MGCLGVVWMFGGDLSNGVFSLSGRWVVFLFWERGYGRLFACISERASEWYIFFCWVGVTCGWG